MTRTVWMGAAVSVAMIGGSMLPRGWRLPVLGGALLAAVLAVATHWEQMIAFKRDRDLTEKETASSVYVRPVLAVLAWHMFLDAPPSAAVSISTCTGTRTTWPIAPRRWSWRRPAIICRTTSFWRC